METRFMKLIPKAFFILTLFTVLAAPQARADILVEPGIGYDLGSVSREPLTTGSAKGIGFNLRAGLDFAAMFFFAADMHYGMPAWTIDVPATSNSATHFALGITGGVKLPGIPLRGWIGYSFINSMSIKDNGGVGVDTSLSGSALKFGIGFGFLPMLSINLEYILNSFGNSETSDVNTVLTESFKDNSLYFSVSLPLTLPF